MTLLILPECCFLATRYREVKDGMGSDYGWSGYGASNLNLTEEQSGKLQTLIEYYQRDRADGSSQGTLRKRGDHQEAFHSMRKDLH